MTETPTPTPTTRREATAIFERLQAKYSHFGALDTEPRAVFLNLVDAAHHGEEVTVPRTATGWQLFSSMDGADAVAEQLAAAAQVVVDIVQA